MPPAGQAGTASAGIDPQGPKGAYNVRLRALERGVNELKEKVFRTKARLNLLKETVLGGVIGASRGRIVHKNDMGGAFKLVQAAYALDGVKIFSRADGAAELEAKTFDVYNGAISPGSHTVTVQLTYQGNGYGVFSYLKGYKFNVRSSHTFVAAEGKSTVLTVVGYEQGGLTVPMEDKPAIEFRVSVMAPDAGKASAATAVSSPSN